MAQRDQGAEEFMREANDEPDASPHPDLALGACARKIYMSRRERDKRSPVPGLFQDPAWDILLDLFISRTENKKISLMSSGLAGQTSTTTALRWVSVLEDAHLVERRLDKADKRRCFVYLSPEGLGYMRETLAVISDQIKAST